MFLHERISHRKNVPPAVAEHLLGSQIGPEAVSRQISLPAMHGTLLLAQVSSADRQTGRAESDDA